MMNAAGGRASTDLASARQVGEIVASDAWIGKVADQHDR